MHNRVDVFRAYVVQDGSGEWYAHCIDLTVDAMGSTREEAIEKLLDAMELYVQWADEQGIPRRRQSPLEFRLRFHYYAARDRLRQLLRQPPKHSGMRRTFSQECRNPLTA